MGYFRACPQCGAEEPPHQALAPHRCRCGYWFAARRPPPASTVTIDITPELPAPRPTLLLPAPKLRESLSPLESSSDNSAKISEKFSLKFSPASRLDSRSAPAPEAPAPPQQVKKHWKVSPEVAARMLKAMEEPPYEPTRQKRSDALREVLIEEARFLDQQNEAASRCLNRLLDRRFPAAGFAELDPIPHGHRGPNAWPVRHHA